MKEKHFCANHRHYLLVVIIIPIILFILSYIGTRIFDSVFDLDSSTINSTFTSTIKISGWDKWDDTIINSLMREEVVLGNNYMKQPMNRNGYVVFANIPNDYKNKTLSIHITKSQNIPFYLADSIIKMGEGGNKITIALRGLDKLCGFVRDEKGDGILNATIILAGIDKKTNERGYFEIDNISIEEQRQEQEIEIFKEGYKTYRGIIPMIGEEPIKIILPFKK